MERITTEILLTTLFKYGFDKIDPILFTFTLASISYKDAKDREFIFSLDEPLSSTFKYCVNRIENVYTLKENRKNKEVWYRYHTNDKLLECLKTIDFKEIINKKIEAFGINKNDIINHPLFSKKEVEFIFINDENINEAVKSIVSKEEDIINNNEYIEWLIMFAKENNNLFYTDKWNYNPEKISAKDKKKVNKIPMFFDIVSEYAEHYPCGNGYYCKIKYDKEIIRIGVMHSQGTVHFVSIAPRSDILGNHKYGYDLGSTEYSQIVEKYNEKPKEYKKTNN